MKPTLVPLNAAIRTAFQSYPQTLAQLELLLESHDASLIEGMARILQIICQYPVEGAFLLREDALEQLLNNSNATERLATLVQIFISEQPS